VYPLAITPLLIAWSPTRDFAQDLTQGVELGTVKCSASRVIIGCTRTDLQDDRPKVLPYVSLIVLEIWYEQELEALGKMSGHRLSPPRSKQASLGGVVGHSNVEVHVRAAETD
jgi:hypothetical protein